jgi:hypothetical protein
MPCRATFNDNGLMIPPCGTPVSVGMEHGILHVSGFEPLSNQFPCGEIADNLHQGGRPDVLEGAYNIGLKNPRPRGVGLCQAKVAGTRPFQGLAQGFELRLPPHEAGEPQAGGLQARMDGSGAISPFI